MRNRGTVGVLKRLENGHYEMADLEFKISGSSVYFLDLFFVIKRVSSLKKSGWRFIYNNEHYFVPPDELKKIFELFGNEKTARFYDVWQIKEN